MGCSNNKEAAIQELNSMVAQMKQENIQLKDHCERITSEKGANSPNNGNKKILQCQSTFEGLVKALDDLATEVENGEKDLKISDIDTITSYEQMLNQKIRKIKELISKENELNKENDFLDKEIEQAEEMVRKMEESFFKDKQAVAKQGTSEIGLETEDLLNELIKAEEVLKDLNEEIRKSGLDDRINDSVQNILELTDFDVDRELVRVDQEIEQLNIKMQTLKSRETEIKQVENYLKNENDAETRPYLKQKINESQARVLYLEEEKQQIQDEIHQMKNSNFEYTELNGKLDILNEMIEKSKSKKESQKTLNEGVVSDIEATLSKVKLLTKDFKKTRL